MARSPSSILTFLRLSFNRLQNPKFFDQARALVIGGENNGGGGSGGDDDDNKQQELSIGGDNNGGGGSGGDDIKQHELAIGGDDNGGGVSGGDSIQHHELGIAGDDNRGGGSGRDDMKQHGLMVCVVDEEFANISVQVCKTIRTQLRWEKTILSEYHSSTLFNNDFVLEFIKTQSDALLSFNFFLWLCSHDGFTPDSKCCNALLNALVQAKAPEAAKCLIQSTDFLPEPASLESFVLCLCENGDVNEAIRCFSVLKTLDYSPPLSVWNSLLSASLQAEETSFVWKLYEEMMECGLVGDVDTLGYVIEAFCKDNKLSDAYKLLREVLESGIVPDATVFTKLISGFSKKRRYRMVSVLLHLMIANNCAPTILTYREIIYWLCKQGHVEEGFEIFNDLKTRGYTIDVVTYSIMVSGLCKMGQLGIARKVWCEMLGKGYLPDECAHNVLLEGYCKSDYLEEAWELFKEMRDRGLRPTKWTFNTMISKLCFKMQMDKAREVFEEMQNLKIEHDWFTYDTLIKGYCMRDNGGNVKDAITLWDNMLCKNVKPCVGYEDYILVKLCEQGYGKEGKDRLGTISQHKLKPSESTFTKILQHFVSHNSLDDALQFVHSVLGMGYALEQPALSHLVGQICKENWKSLITLEHIWKTS